MSLGTGSDAGQVIAEPCTVQGDVALIAGRAWPARVQGQRDALLQRMRRDAYVATLEAVAYTWFNRLAALRFMELHDDLGHGRRVLSNPVGGAGGLPEVLAHALDLAESGNLPGLRVDKVRELRLANHDGEAPVAGSSAPLTRQVMAARLQEVELPCYRVKKPS